MPRSAPLILVLGVTGVGKSTFICSAAGRKDRQHLNLPVINGSLTSSQVEPEGFEVVSQDGKAVLLVDTPGFNDTLRGSDKFIIDSIKSFLEKGDYAVTGLIYLVDASNLDYGPVKIKNLPVPPPVVVATSHESHVVDVCSPNKDAMRVKLEATYSSAYQHDHFGPQDQYRAAWKIIDRVLDCSKGSAISANVVIQNLDSILQDRPRNAGKNISQPWYRKILRLFKFN